jgi:pyruvate dehydrogenase phosphatase
MQVNYEFCIIFQATTILQENEYSLELNQRSIKSFDTNQLSSNNPVEDARAEGRSLFTTGKTISWVDRVGR